ncbi:glycosyltransferase [Methylobacterium oxalidis]|uniref:glycosyltransferase n=1 Tax=Methylobacterium oxalidis TaxID=944322 RepID=UPI003314AE97
MKPLQPNSDDQRPIRVFVHLAYGFDARKWERSWLEGHLVGFNTRTPYGYHLAEAAGCKVQFSEDRPEGRFRRLVRLGFRALLGFDLVHAWRNRRAARDADVIWTHTESQFLSFALIRALSRWPREPKLLGQAVWLIDRWDHYGPLRRALYRALLQHVDVLTVLSPLNLARARALFPGTRCELVLFGIPTDERAPARSPAAAGRLQVVAIGNDEHRDWDTLLAALGGCEACDLRIVTAVLPPERADRFPNVRIGRITRNDELRSLYRTADLMVVPLKPNLHASGITVMQEAALSRLPMVVSDVGGLRPYFADTAVRYVPAGQPQALRDAVLNLARDSGAQARLAEEASARMGPNGLGAESYVRRHVELSLDLLADTGCVDPAVARP